MYRKIEFLLMLLFVFAATSWAQQDPANGTWKLNISKSKFTGAAPKSRTITYASDGKGGSTYTLDGINAQGVSTHITMSYKDDGKDYPVVGDASRDMVSIKRIDQWTIEGTNKKDGKLTGKYRREISKDGKTMTTTNFDLDGKPTGAVSVYDK